MTQHNSAEMHAEIRAEMDAAIAEAHASAPQNVIILCALEINHPAFTEPCRLVCWPVTDEEPKRFHLLHEPDAPFAPGQTVEYLGVPFEVTTPESSAETPGTFAFRADNVGDTLDADLEAAALQGGKIEAIFREYIKGSEADGPRSVWEGINIKSPRMDGFAIVADGAVLEWLLKVFGRLYTPELYPALVRGR